MPETATATAALERIDGYMADLSNRKLESTDTVIDVLLDVRSLVAGLDSRRN